MRKHITLESVIEPTVSGLGYEFVGLEFMPQGKYSALRIYIDRPSGISLEDCEKVSRQVGSVLDVESELVRGAYTLEVSSPGVDRKIFTLEQFPRFVGQQVRLTLQTPLDGQRNFKGILCAVNDDTLVLEVNGKVVNIEYVNVAQANLIA